MIFPYGESRLYWYTVLFVRLKLEFTVAVWNPWLERDVEIMEKVQERAIRILSDRKGESHEGKYRDAGLTTLKERRADLIL